MADSTGTFGRSSRLNLMWFEGRSGEERLVRFDVVTVETYEALTSITSHPVEEGADVSDHARSEPITVSVEGFLSYTPLFSNPDVEKDAEYRNVPLRPLYPAKLGGAPIFTPGGLASAAVGAIGDLFGQAAPPQANPMQFTDPGRARRRVLEKIEWLQIARLDATPLRVICGGSTQELENMLISRISLPRTPEDFGGVVVQLDLKQVRIVSTEIVGAPKTAEERGQPTVNTGSKGTVPATPKQEEVAASFGVQIGQAFGLFKGPP